MPLRLLLTLAQLSLALAALALPLAGVWVASSLAAYSSGPVWAAQLAGLLLFPMLPLAWDLWYTRRRAQRFLDTPPRLGFGTRFLLRTLILDGGFLAAILWLAPGTVFAAISARGDWMLDGRSGTRAEAARSALFWAADRCEWLYGLAMPNRFAEPDPVVAQLPPSRPDSGVEPKAVRGGARPSLDAGATPDAGATDAGEVVEISVDDAGVTSIRVQGHSIAEQSSAQLSWPLPDAIDPVARAVPSDLASWSEVARYVGEHARGEVARAKILHDWVAEMISYDDEAVASKVYPPQDPASVFRSRRAVCRGYTDLYNAMLGELGIEAVPVVGSIRDEKAQVVGSNHAWSAVRLDGQWQLVDVTWDSPHHTTAPAKSDAGEKTRARRQTVRSDYLLTPPEVFGFDHFPDDPRWQLRARPMSRGEFVRQPMLSPRFEREGLVLVAPERSQVDASGEIEIVIDNRRNRFLMAEAEDSGGRMLDCQDNTTGGRQVRLKCRLAENDNYRILIFSNDAAYGQFEYVAQVQVSNRI